MEGASRRGKCCARNEENEGNCGGLCKSYLEGAVQVCVTAKQRKDGEENAMVG